MPEPTVTPAPADTATPPAIVTPPADKGTPPPAFAGPKWLSEFPDDVKSNETLWKYTSEESAARGLINAQRLIGMEKVPKPKGDFDPASPDWQPFLEAMGRPKDAKDYEFPEVTLPEGMTYDKALEDKFRGVAHSLGLNGFQAKGLQDFFAAYQTEAFTGQTRDFTQEKTAATAELKQELGQAYDGYVEASKAAMKEYMSPNFVAMLEKTGLGNDPEMIRTFGKIGRETLGEAKLKAAGITVQASPQELQAQIAEFRSRNEKALYDRSHPDNARLTAELTRMSEAAYGTEPIRT